MSSAFCKSSSPVYLIGYCLIFLNINFKIVKNNNEIVYLNCPCLELKKKANWLKTIKNQNTHKKILNIIQKIYKNAFIVLALTHTPKKAITLMLVREYARNGPVQSTAGPCLYNRYKPHLHQIKQLWLECLW